MKKKLLKLAPLFLQASLALVDAAVSKDRAVGLLNDLGFSEKEVDNVFDGNLIKRVQTSVNAREIGMAFAVLVQDSPKRIEDTLLCLRMKKKVDPHVKAYKILSDESSPEEFSSLKLEGPNGAKLAKQLKRAKAGNELNLSKDEIEAFQQGDKHQVEPGLRTMLWNRFQAYKKHGLLGILPYARDNGDFHPSDDLLDSSKTMSLLQKEVPHFFRHLMTYPDNRPDELVESHSWVVFDVDKEPRNIELLHRMGVYSKDGAFVFSERQYFVLNGYNCVQGVGGAIPLDQGQTLVLFSSRTSTDAVAGFGGSAKRAIGVRMMGNMVEKILEKYREEERHH